MSAVSVLAQGAAPDAGAKTGMKLEVVDGSRASYRVREQLVGIDFPNDAVGTTEAVTGAIVFRPDGTIDSSQSKLTVDLRTLRTDQERRDGFVAGPRLLDTEKFPYAEFVPKRVTKMPWPLPSGEPPQAGFQMIGDLTIRGTTKEVAWNTVATFDRPVIGVRAVTEFTFPEFKLDKPSIARLLSVDDKIALELDVRLSRTPMP